MTVDFAALVANIYRFVVVVANMDRVVVAMNTCVRVVSMDRLVPANQFVVAAAPTLDMLEVVVRVLQHAASVKLLWIGVVVTDVTSEFQTARLVVVVGE